MKYERGRKEEWCGVEERSKGRGKEGCALLMCYRVLESIEAHGWKSLG